MLRLIQGKTNLVFVVVVVIFVVFVISVLVFGQPALFKQKNIRNTFIFRLILNNDMLEKEHLNQVILISLE